MKLLRSTIRPTKAYKRSKAHIQEYVLAIPMQYDVELSMYSRKYLHSITAQVLRSVQGSKHWTSIYICTGPQNKCWGLHRARNTGHQFISALDHSITVEVCTGFETLHSNLSALDHRISVEVCTGLETLHSNLSALDHSRSVEVCTGLETLHSNLSALDHSISVEVCTGLETLHNNLSALDHCIRVEVCTGSENWISEEVCTGSETLHSN